MPVEAFRLNPKDKFANANLSDAYLSLGRYDEAKAVIEQADAQGLGSPTDAFSLYTMAFMRDDKAGMQRAVELGKGPSVEPIMLFIEGMGQCAFGQDTKCQAKLCSGVTSAQKAGLKELAAGIRLIDASCLAEVGNQALARQVASQALAVFGRSRYAHGGCRHTRPGRRCHPVAETD